MSQAKNKGKTKSNEQKLRTSKTDKVILLFVILVPALILMSIAIFGSVNQPFEEGTEITFQAIDFGTDQNVTDAEVDLYYLNVSSYTEQEIEEVTNDMFVDFYTFNIDDVITANGSYLYRFYVYAENYTGYFGYPTVGLNKVYLAKIPTLLNMLAINTELGTSFNDTDVANWSIQFNCDDEEGFIPFYNKTAEENSSIVVKVTFDQAANISWVDYDGNYNTNKTAIGNSVFIELYNFAFLESGILNIALDEASLNIDFSTETIAIGYGNSNNYVELDQQI